MKKKLIIAIALIAGALGTLIYFAVSETSKAIVTVAQLKNKGAVHSVRLGARVASVPIDYQTQPKFMLKFSVRDIPDNAESVKLAVVYAGMMPDTLKVGRDVILEGNYDGNQFQAQTLLTQCPSKYRPPDPSASASTQAPQ